MRYCLQASTGLHERKKVQTRIPWQEQQMKFHNNAMYESRAQATWLKSLPIFYIKNSLMPMPVHQVRTKQACSTIGLNQRGNTFCQINV